ncbi:acyl-CoA carboxylase epsilon subunit [Streptomyces sp. NPDC019443]|uniref:acyl-CoA carboxylase epsilon subunit n=1 Tax=Streptomyces sp. NPDC019443 TaxID=3365061 RepID=UPI00379A5E06
MPPIKVLYGQPTPEELAAVIAVVQARAATVAAAPEPPRRPPVSAWTDRAAAIALRRQTLPRLINLTTTTPAEPTR